MKTALILLLLISLACHNGHALPALLALCQDGRRVGTSLHSQRGVYVYMSMASITCPQCSDACTTITGTRSVLKMCSDRAYCNKGSAGSSASKVECCYSDNCNKPPIKNSGTAAVPLVSNPVRPTVYNPIQPTVYSLVGPLVSSPTLLIMALLLGVTFSQL